MPRSSASLIISYNGSLQSVMNSSTRLTYPPSRFSHITPLFQRLHWLMAKERIYFKVAVLVYKRQSRTVPPYLADAWAMLFGGRPRACSRLRSASLSQLVVRQTCRSTLGDQSFVVAGPRLWNNLPLTSARHIRFLATCLQKSSQYSPV